jgi:hypothetical protein
METNLYIRQYICVYFRSQYYDHSIYIHKEIECTKTQGYFCTYVAYVCFHFQEPAARFGACLPTMTIVC